ncbi:MAG: hypothetical protein JRG91_15880 [Deltaproteobacteria bacterium]|nr:hypothetical protein [Deltaproteobacteria bacterium]
MQKLAIVLAGSLLAFSCDPGGTKVDAHAEPQPDVDGVHGCAAPGDCAVGVNYRDLSACAQPGAYSASHVEAEECITGLGEVPGTSCEECAVTSDSGRGGRLPPGRWWVLACTDSVCVASEEPCTPAECPEGEACTTSLDCFLTFHCLEGTCTSGCDTGFDCRTSEVCVREPPDAAFGRCVFSG